MSSYFVLMTNTASLANLAIYLSTRVQGLGTRPSYKKNGQLTEPRTKAIPIKEVHTPTSRLAISAK